MASSLTVKKRAYYREQQIGKYQRDITIMKSIDYNRIVIGRRLREIRLDAKLTQVELADICGKGLCTMTAYESGRSEIPIIVLVILSVMNYNINWLLIGEGNKKIGEK